MDELEIVYLQTDSLIPYANNAKRHPQSQIDQIAASIERFGFSDSVGVWQNERGEHEIVYGHGSVMAAKKLGIDKLPCVVLNHLTDDERRAYCHVHNQLTLLTGLDDAIIASDMASISINWDDFGFTVPQDDISQEIFEDAIPEQVERRCHYGEVWTLGAHRVMCGSATDERDMESLAGGVLCESAAY